MEHTTRIDPADIARQRDFCAQVRERNAALPAPPLAFVDTYGCQQNEADSERIRGFLSEMGYGFTPDEALADVIVINTCAVREHAEQRVLGNVGALVHAKRAHPGQILCLCGCMMQEPHNVEKIRRSFRHVDLVFGPHALWRFPELLWRVVTRRGRVFDTPDEAGSIAEGLPVRREGSVKAWVSIMYGCNNFCSYCIVPYVRGRERSRQPEDILAEVRDLAQDGYKDITLLGQNVNSYGKDLGLHGVDFAWLLEQVNAVPGEFLIRFMTSHPKDASERLFDTMAGCEKVAPHLHLPFQAGNDRVLRAMHRGYTQEHYLGLIQSLRARIPDIVLTSDVIVGFPGETTQEFEDTLKVLEAVEFDALFTFLYSPRKGTPAAELPDPMPKEEKAANFQRLVDLQNAISARKQAAYVGKSLRCLVDVCSDDPRHNLNARTAGGRLVHFSGDEALLGQFVDLKITGASTWALFGALA
ncbi:tRNA (N6-isopentenyl adenosine(37)-C2)-methylthiotransferase MiaB [uncultured Intestinimonas sp.]|uniref:tRNA (N6-isopentenyl adenosine(37)-C2)-methylthiotransferase MiaB n=1 Tax=uncultured Intestinimonas sp. TaxID=1689265 RepID=UPI0025F5E515|nr:tRNA (N6-isopentenyl adenosine(37)-C2)-methylthiotransferase MiaB [uncultured Intestinimonas sp.]